MDFKSIIDKYYPEDNKLRWILITHSTLVMKRAVKICDAHPELGLDSSSSLRPPCSTTSASSVVMPLE